MGFLRWFGSPAWSACCPHRPSSLGMRTAWFMPGTFSRRPAPPVSSAPPPEALVDVQMQHGGLSPRVTVRACHAYVSAPPLHWWARDRVYVCGGPCHLHYSPRKWGLLPHFAEGTEIQSDTQAPRAWRACKVHACSSFCPHQGPWAELGVPGSSHLGCLHRGSESV